MTSDIHSFLKLITPNDKLKEIIINSRNNSESDEDILDDDITV